MLTTDEVKRIAAIMLHGAPKTKPKAEHIVRQLLMLPDALRADFDEVKAFLYDLVELEKQRTPMSIKKYKKVEKSYHSINKDRKEYGASVFDRNISERKG